MSLFWGSCYWWAPYKGLHFFFLQLEKIYIFLKTVHAYFPPNRPHVKQLLLLMLHLCLMLGCPGSYSHDYVCSDVQMLFFHCYRHDIAWDFIFCLTWLAFTPRRTAWVKNIHLHWRAACECLTMCTIQLKETHPISLISVDDCSEHTFIYSQIIFYEALQMWRREDKAKAEAALKQWDCQVPTWAAEVNMKVTVWVDLGAHCSGSPVVLLNQQRCKHRAAEVMLKDVLACAVWEWGQQGPRGACWC